MQQLLTCERSSEQAGNDFVGDSFNSESGEFAGLVERNSDDYTVVAVCPVEAFKLLLERRNHDVVKVDLFDEIAADGVNLVYQTVPKSPAKTWQEMRKLVKR